MVELLRRLPVVYVVTVLALLPQLALVVVLVACNTFARRAEIRTSWILSFQESADLRDHVGGGVTLLASNAAVLPFQRIPGKPMVKLFDRRFPMNQRKILAIVLQMAANAILAIGILHLKPRVVSEVF